MPAMKKIGFVMAMVLGLGCGGGDKISEALKGLEDYKGKACACKDKGCAEKVKADYDKWKDGMRKSFKEEDMKKMTKEQDQKFDDIEDALSACLDKHLEAGGGETPPAPTP